MYDIVIPVPHYTLIYRIIGNEQVTSQKCANLRISPAKSLLEEATNPRWCGSARRPHEMQDASPDSEA